MSAGGQQFVAGAAVATVSWALHRLWVRWAFGTGRLRGRRRELAPGQFASLSYGACHYVISGRDGAAVLDPSGQRPLVVLVHGFGGSCKVWSDSRYSSALSAAGFDVLCFDNWGLDLLIVAR